ncbi:MAG: hypothetical protein ACX98W_20525 [bacterium]
MRKREIILDCSIAGLLHSHQYGERIEVTEIEAARMVKAGQAHYPPDKPEETAATRTARGRGRTAA